MSPSKQHMKAAGAVPPDNQLREDDNIKARLLSEMLSACLAKVLITVAA